MIEPSAFVQAVNATRHHVLSARPDAPVATRPTRGSGRGDPLRRRTAVLLRRLADRVEPAPADCRAAPA